MMQATDEQSAAGPCEALVPRARWRGALAACARDADVPLDDVSVLDVRPHYKSIITLAGVVGCGEPRWVIKTDVRPDGESSWSPRVEYEGLRYVASRMPQAAPHLGSITPLACCDGPKWLLTRYQHGRSAKEIVDRAMFRPRSDAAEARAVMRRLAGWLTALRATPPGDGGLDMPRYLTFCDQRLDEIGAVYGAAAVLDRTRRTLRRLTDQLDERRLERLSRAFPTHADMATQNFLVDGAGSVYALDLECFAFKPLDEDLARLRMRFEQDAFRRPWARGSAEALWREFCSAYVPPDEHAWAVLAYLHKMLAHVAWLGKGWRPRRPLRRWIKTEWWVRGRLRWLADLPDDADEAHHMLRDRI